MYVFGDHLVQASAFCGTHLLEKLIIIIIIITVLFYDETLIKYS